MARVGLRRAFVAVLWSFLGIRKDADYQADITQLSAGQVIIAGIICTLLFVFTLIGVVYLVTHH
jgi:hypothetical protein